MDSEMIDPADPQRIQNAPLASNKKSRKCGLFIRTLRDFFEEDDMYINKLRIFDYYPSTSEIDDPNRIPAHPPTLIVSTGP